MTQVQSNRRRARSESSTANGPAKSEKSESENNISSDSFDPILLTPSSPGGSNHYHRCLLSDRQIHFLAERTPTDWERILRHFDLPNHQIEAIKLDHQRAYERAFQGYLQWKKNVKDEATICAVLDVLGKIGKHELRKEMEHEFSHKSNQQSGKKVSRYMASVKHFVGRKDEMDVIYNFLDKSIKSPFLLCVNGLPGSGKKELIIEAVNRAYVKNTIEPSQIVKPNFMMEDKEEWSFDDLLDCILKELRKFVQHKISGKVDILDLLSELSKPCLLILEIAHLNLKSKIFNQIWTLIHDVLRNNKNDLKIIATSCRHPDGILCGTIECIKIHLGDLVLEESTELLNKLSRSLHDTHIKSIYQCVGGNPWLLRKISARINSYSNKNEQDLFIKSITLDVQPLANNCSVRNDCISHQNFYRRELSIHEELYIIIKSSTWWRDMTCVFKMMDDREKKLLAYLSAFHGKIPRSSLCSIFEGEPELKKIADNICMNHCILQKIDKDSCFFLTEFYKTFIIKHIEDGTFAQIRDNAKIDITTFYVKLLVELAKLSFSKARKTNFLCDKFVNDYRKTCDKCKSGHCECDNFTIAKGIFIHHKQMIHRSLKKIMSFQETGLLFQAPYDLVVFLRHVLTLKELTEVYDLIWNLSAKDLTEKAVTLACLVFIKVHTVKKYKDEQKIYLIMLNQSIEVLETIMSPSLEVQELLLACYLKKASILARVFKDFISAEKDMGNAEEIYEMNHIRKGKFHFHATEAEIFHCKKEFKKANTMRQEQVKRSRENLGNHPFTAKALFLYGKTLEKNIRSKNIRSMDNMKNVETDPIQLKKNIQRANENYLDCISMYHKLDCQYDVGRACSSFGRYLLSRNRIVDAQNIFQYGVDSVFRLRNTCKDETSYFYKKCTRLVQHMDQMSTSTTDDESFYEPNYSKQKKSLKVPVYRLSKRRSIMFMFFNPRSKMFYVFIAFLFLFFLVYTFHETKPGQCIAF